MFRSGVGLCILNRQRAAAILPNAHITQSSKRAKVVGATSNEGFLISSSNVSCLKRRLHEQEIYVWPTEQCGWH